MEVIEFQVEIEIETKIGVEKGREVEIESAAIGKNGPDQKTEIEVDIENPLINHRGIRGI